MVMLIGGRNDELHDYAAEVSERSRVALQLHELSE